MSDKKEEKRKYRFKPEESNDVQEEGRESSDIDEEEGMQTYMSDEANKCVRDKYERLMTVLHEHTDEEKNMDTHNLQLLVLEANEAFCTVKRPREAAIDAQFLKVCGNMAKHNLETSQSNLIVFKAREFAEKLIEFATKEDEHSLENPEVSIMARLSKKISHFFNNVPGVQPLFSAIEGERPAPKERKKTKKSADDMVSQEAQKVAVLKDHQGEEEAEAVAWIYKTLKHCYAAAGNTSIPFYEFAIDPGSFSRSVENMFHISLLVREQYAELIEDKDSLPQIQPVQKKGTEGPQKDSKQCIFSMDMEEWQEVIKVFEITHAMIPRKNPQSKKKRK